MLKKNNQDIADIISGLTSETKEDAAIFVQAVLDSIVEGLQNDGKVEFDGIGVFGTVKMAQRESVNISNGERITLPEYTKLTFNPSFDFISTIEDDTEDGDEDAKTVDESTNQNVNGDKEDESETDTSESEMVPDVEVNDEASADENNQREIDENQQPAVLEKPVDAFSGIDVLISTPESLEDMKLRLSEAQKKETLLSEKITEAKQALVDAQKAYDEAQADLKAAQDEVKSLSETVDNVENNRRAVIDSENQDDSPMSDATANGVNHDDNHSSVSSQAGKNSLYAKDKDGDGGKPRINLKYVFFGVAICMAITLLLVKLCSNSDKEDNRQDLNTNKKELVQDNNQNDNVDKSQQPKPVVEDKSNTGEGAKATVQKSEEENLVHKGKNVIGVDTVVFDGSKLLEHIVVDFYGEHDMVYKVIDFNRKHGQLKDLKNIPKGTKILMPKYE